VNPFADCGYRRFMLSPIYETRLADLLAAWRFHQDVRRAKGSIPELATARQLLDETRHDAYRARRALNPEPSEATEALATAYCEVIDETVFLFATDASWESPVSFTCLCGRTVSHTEGPSH
jgi:hypothetical protein